MLSHYVGHSVVEQPTHFTTSQRSLTTGSSCVWRLLWPSDILVCQIGYKTWRLERTNKDALVISSKYAGKTSVDPEKGLFRQHGLMQSKEKRSGTGAIVEEDQRSRHICCGSFSRWSVVSSHSYATFKANGSVKIANSVSRSHGSTFILLEYFSKAMLCSKM